jgi:hypothetical protein
MCLFDLWWICSCKYQGSSSKSSGKTPQNGASPARSLQILQASGTPHEGLCGVSQTVAILRGSI